MFGSEHRGRQHANSVDEEPAMRSMSFSSGFARPFSWPAPIITACMSLAALVLAVTAPAVLAQQLTPDQIIEALKSRTSRGIGPAPGQGRGMQAEPQDDAARRMSELLSILRQRGARAFTAKQREELADLSQNEPSINLVVYFDLDSATVRADSKQTLGALGTALKNAALRNDRFLISGHTDASGGAAYNLGLSQRRAEAVSAYLKQAFGIENERLQPIGYGKERLKRPDAPLSGENRRVQVVNVSAANSQAAAASARQPPANDAKPAPSPAPTPAVAPASNAGASGTECRRFSPQANKTVPCD
jgi:outer membrane protein OmpA-like peptidoglycan-associated protein